MNATDQGSAIPPEGSGTQRLSYAYGSGEYPVTEYVVWEDPFGIVVNETFVSARAYYDGYSVYAVDCDDYEYRDGDTGWYTDWDYANFNCWADSEEAAYDVNMHFENDDFCASTTTNTYYVDEIAYADPGNDTVTGWINWTWSDGACAWLLDYSAWPAQWEFVMAPSQRALMPATDGSR